MYLDANSLYGWAMSQPMPTGNVQWVSQETIPTIDFLNIPDDCETGYILEVDLEYPAELHDAHSSYPLAPEKRAVKQEWLSDFQHYLLGDKRIDNYKRILNTVTDKNLYVIHYRNLKLYVSLGMRLKKIHRVLSFSQNKWMAPYIDMNTELRKKAKSGFEKDLFKLMNNSVYGKTLENVRKRIDFKIARSEEEDKIRKLSSSTGLQAFVIFNENLLGFHMSKSHVLMDKPIYVGFSVLELSKLFMYEFYYNKLKKQYGDRVEVLYTDTDSLLLEIETEDPYVDIAANMDDYDTSDYPDGHFLHDKTNKKVIGKMKDEMAGKPIAEYIGLRAKMYSIMGSEGSLVKKAKGVSKVTLKKDIKHENYRKTLEEHMVYRHEMIQLRSSKHDIYMNKVNKVSLSPTDTKRYIRSDGINTYPFGHFKIKEELEACIDEMIDEMIEPVEVEQVDYEQVVDQSLVEEVVNEVDDLEQEAEEIIDHEVEVIDLSIRKATGPVVENIVHKVLPNVLIYAQDLVKDLVERLEKENETDTTIIAELNPEVVLDDNIFDYLEEKDEKHKENPEDRPDYEPDVNNEANESDDFTESNESCESEDEDVEDDKDVNDVPDNNPTYNESLDSEYVFEHVLTNNLNIKEILDEPEKRLDRFNNAKLCKVWEGIHSVSGEEYDCWDYELKRREFLRVVFEKLKDDIHSERVNNGLSSIKQLLDFQRHVPYGVDKEFVIVHLNDECSTCSNLKKWWFKLPVAKKEDIVEPITNPVKHVFENVLTSDFHIDNLFKEVSNGRSSLYNGRHYQEQRNCYVWVDYHDLLENSDRSQYQNDLLNLCIYELKRRCQLRHIYDKIKAFMIGSSVEKRLYQLLEYYEDNSHIDSDFIIEHENDECEVCSDTKICDCSFDKMCWLCEWLHGPDYTIDKTVEKLAAWAVEQTVYNVLDWTLSLDDTTDSEAPTDSALQDSNSSESTPEPDPTDDEMIDLSWFDLTEANCKKEVVKRKKKGTRVFWDPNVTDYDRFILKHHSEALYIMEKNSIRARVFLKTSCQTADDFMFAYDSFLEEVCTKHKSVLVRSADSVFVKFRHAITTAVNTAVLGVVDGDTKKKIQSKLLKAFNIDLKKPIPRTPSLQFVKRETPEVVFKRIELEESQSSASPDESDASDLSDSADLSDATDSESDYDYPDKEFSPYEDSDSNLSDLE